MDYFRGVAILGDDGMKVMATVWARVKVSEMRETHGIERSGRGWAIRVNVEVP